MIIPVPPIGNTYPGTINVDLFQHGCSKSSAYATILRERGQSILAIVQDQFTSAIKATGVIPAELLTNGLALVGSGHIASKRVWSS